MKRIPSLNGRGEHGNKPSILDPKQQPEVAVEKATTNDVSYGLLLQTDREQRRASTPAVAGEGQVVADDRVSPA